MPADLFNEDALDREFRALSNEQPAPSLIAELSNKLPSVRPVRPLPSNGVLASLYVSGLLGLVFLIAVTIGLQGVRARQPVQIVGEYGFLGITACLLGVAVVREIIPGSRQPLSTAKLVILSLLGFAVVIAALYSDWRLADFVHRGMPCLRLALLCAVPAGLLCFGLMRLGFLTDPVHAAATAGALSGLTGVTVLALHCPLLNAPHMLVWHLSAVIIATLVGALIGWFVPRR